jgi:hypothetical protein
LVDSQINGVINKNFTLMKHRTQLIDNRHGILMLILLKDPNWQKKNFKEICKIKASLKLLIHPINYVPICAKILFNSISH